jgi:hypothetical protein
VGGEGRRTPDGSSFPRVEVRRPNGHMTALTNPVILA